MLLNHLTKLGLSQGEAKIYLALLNHGDATATELSGKTSLGRTNIYNYAKSLQDKNLIKDYERNSKIYFQVTDPKELYNILELKKKDLNNLSVEHLNLLPRISKLYHETNKSPQVAFYLGKKDWKKVMKQIYLEHEEKEMFVLVKDLADYSPPPPIYQNSLYTNKTMVYLIANVGENLEAFLKRDEKKNRKTVLIDRNILPITKDTIIFKNNIFFGDFDPNNFEVFSIQNRHLPLLLVYLLKNIS